MSTTIVDDIGPADMGFHGIPLRTLKKVKFTNKIGTAYYLLKMIINGATYNFEETSKNGAVIFNDDFSGWVFVAPDGRLKFKSYVDMTIGEVFDDMEAILSEQPIPSWDSFVVWLNDNLGEEGLPVEGANAVGIRTVSCPDGQQELEVDIPDFRAINCVEFLNKLESTCAAALDTPVSYLQSPTGGIAFDMYLYEVNDANEKKVLLRMAFTFRE